MPITLGNNTSLILEVPSKGETGWADSLRANGWQKIVDHDHSTGKGVRIGTAGIADNAINGTKLRLQNAEWIRARNAANTADINVIRVNSSDVIEFSGDVAPGDNTVSTVKLQDNAVTTAKIADNAITNAKVADNAVNTAEIADSAVTTIKINDDAVTPAKMSVNTEDMYTLATGSEILPEGYSNIKLNNASVVGDTITLKTNAVYRFFSSDNALTRTVTLTNGSGSTTLEIFNGIVHLVLSRASGSITVFELASNN